MISSYDKLDSYVITKNGVKNLDNVIIGDWVYGSTSNRLYEVKDIIERVELVNKVTYSDGRVINIAVNETHFEELRTLPIVYDKIMNRLHPDANISGALFIYGDYEDEYMNLPLDLYEKIYNLITNKYELIISNKLGNNKVYFSYKNKPDKILKWEDFFNTCSGFNIDNYLKASVKDRVKFVMGVFDLGYNYKYFPDNEMAIAHHDCMKLKIVQEVLWSLGISSTIEYDEFYKEEGIRIRKKHKRYYSLKLFNKNLKPSLFYNFDLINKSIVNENSIDRNLDNKIEIINKEIIGYKLIKNLCFDKRIWYYTDNYLVRNSQ